MVVGNCQAKALAMMLSTNESLTRRFELVSFPPVHEISDALVPELHRAVAGAAVLIVQRVDEGFRDGVGLGTETLAGIADNATVVRWPSLYWAGYFPDLFYLRDAAGSPVVDGPFDYHDRTILEAYADGLDISQTCRLMEDPARGSHAQAWATAASAELAIRGRGCDIDATAFIAERFREALLFFTVNHPSNRLLAFLAQQITDLLAVPGAVDRRRIPDEILGSTFYPIHANHARMLDLEFASCVTAGRAPFRIRGVSLDSSEAVRGFMDYYAQHPDLVAINLAATR